MADEYKTTEEQKLEELGGMLAKYRAEMDAAEATYKEACVMFDDQIDALATKKAEATKDLGEAWAKKRTMVKTLSNEILDLWTSVDGLPKTIKTVDWKMQMRINRVLEVKDKDELYLRLQEIGKYDDVVKRSYDKAKLKKLVEAEMFAPTVVALTESPTLAFSPKKTGGE